MQAIFGAFLIFSGIYFFLFSIGKINLSKDIEKNNQFREGFGLMMKIGSLCMFLLGLMWITQFLLA